MGEKKVLTTWEAGRYCGVSPYTVRHWINSGQLEAYTTPGGHRRIPRKTLDDFLRRHNMPVPTAFQEGNKRVLILAAGPEADALARDMRTWADDLTVTLARSGFEAGFEVSSRPPHLFIVDVDDPRWDGIAVFRAVHEDGRGSRVQMAAMGMDSSVERMEALQRAGVLHCFSKPVDRADLCRFVKRMFPSCDWKVNLRKASRAPDR